MTATVFKKKKKSKVELVCLKMSLGCFFIQHQEDDAAV